MKSLSTKIVTCSILMLACNTAIFGAAQAPNRLSIEEVQQQLAQLHSRYDMLTVLEQTIPSVDPDFHKTLTPSDHAQLETLNIHATPILASAAKTILTLSVQKIRACIKNDSKLPQGSYSESHQSLLDRTLVLHVMERMTVPALLAAALEKQDPGLA